MDRLHDTSCLFGGAFIANVVSHFGGGMIGDPFRARLPSQGHSSTTVSVLSRLANFTVTNLLIARLENFDLHVTDNIRCRWSERPAWRCVNRALALTIERQQPVHAFLTP